MISWGCRQRQATCVRLLTNLKKIRMANLSSISSWRNNPTLYKNSNIISSATTNNSACKTKRIRSVSRLRLFRKSCRSSWWVVSNSGQESQKAMTKLFSQRVATSTRWKERRRWGSAAAAWHFNRGLSWRSWARMSLESCRLKRRLTNNWCYWSRLSSESAY